MKDKLRTTALPVLAALIWGTAFVAQKVNTMGALGFTAARSFIAVLFILPMILVFTKGDAKHILSEETKENTKMLWIGGILTGLFMGSATFFQQKGMDLGTEASKAGFLTALYVVLVPVLGIFMKQKVRWQIWIGVGLAAVGLYLICIKKGFTFMPSDLVVLISALLFAFQIQSISHFSVYCNPVKMSCIQFLSAFIVLFILSLIFEKNTWALVGENIFSILYLGIFSSGIAYTLQIISQKNANPAVITILMSLESVFSVLASALFLHEVLTVREYIGCAVMFAAVIIAQLSVLRSSRT